MESSEKFFREDTYPESLDEFLDSCLETLESFFYFAYELEIAGDRDVERFLKIGETLFHVVEQEICNLKGLLHNNFSSITIRRATYGHEEEAPKAMLGIKCIPLKIDKK